MKSRINNNILDKFAGKLIFKENVDDIILDEERQIKVNKYLYLQNKQAD